MFTELQKHYMTIRYNNGIFEQIVTDNTTTMGEELIKGYIVAQKDTALKNFFETFLQTHYSHYEIFSKEKIEIEKAFAEDMVTYLKKGNVIFFKFY